MMSGFLVYCAAVAVAAVAALVVAFVVVAAAAAVDSVAVHHVPLFSKQTTNQTTNQTTDVSMDNKLVVNAGIVKRKNAPMASWTCARSRSYCRFFALSTEPKAWCWGREAVLLPHACTKMPSSAQVHTSRLLLRDSIFSIKSATAVRILAREACK